MLRRYCTELFGLVTRDPTGCSCCKGFVVQSGHDGFAEELVNVFESQAARLGGYESQLLLSTG